MTVSKTAKHSVQPALMAPAASISLRETIGELDQLNVDRLRLQWRNHLGGSAPAHLLCWLLMRVLAYRMQAVVLGDLDVAIMRMLRTGEGSGNLPRPFALRTPATRDGVDLRPGALLAREWQGKLERVMILEGGFAWNGRSFGSLSQVAKAITGTSWNGHRFFGLRQASTGKRPVTQVGGVKTAKAGSAGRARRRNHPPPESKQERRAETDSMSEVCT